MKAFLTLWPHPTSPTQFIPKKKLAISQECEACIQSSQPHAARMLQHQLWGRNNLHNA
jgi:hypothetical protein